MEYYDLSPDGEWTGPFFRWSPTGPNDNTANVELHGFFLDDLAMDPYKTCYIDLCEDDPCAKGQACESTWDGENAGFTCHGGMLIFGIFIVTHIEIIIGKNVPGRSIRIPMIENILIQKFNQSWMKGYYIKGPSRTKQNVKILDLART